MDATARPRNWVSRVRRFVDAPRSLHAEATRCDLCSQPIPSHHAHLVEPEKHRLLCVCQGCDTLLGDRADRKYVRVPHAARILRDFRVSDAEWDALGIPIGLAFFFFSTPENRVIALYPGPAGPTESLLPLDAWSGIAMRNPAVAALAPDVEALLVNRIDNARDYYAVPIDRCYALVGLIRTKWKGVAGGKEARDAINGFFAGLRGTPSELRVPQHG